MSSQRLIKFAEKVAAGMTPAEAARDAGYAPSTAEHARARLVPQAIDAGLLPDPDERAALVAEFERRLASRLLEVADQLGDKAARGDLTAIKEFLDRFLGRSRQPVDMDVTHKPAIGSVDDWRKALGLYVAEDDTGATDGPDRT